MWPVWYVPIAFMIGGILTTICGLLWLAHRDRRNEWRRERKLLDEGGWGVNLATGQWHYGHEQGTLPDLPTVLFRDLPLRMQRALIEAHRNKGEGHGETDHRDKTQQRASLA